MNDFKALIEQRNEIVDDINKMFETAETEKRAFTTEEQAKFDAKTEEINNIDTTLKMHEQARSLDKTYLPKASGAKKEDTYEIECRAFADYVRGSDVNWTMGDNGAVIPQTIANKIIETVENISPVYAMATKYHTKGKLIFPVYDEKTHKHEMAYAEEFSALTSTSGRFVQAELSGFLAGTLTKISKSLINNAQFAIVPYIITKMSQAISRFVESEILLGDGDKHMRGILNTAALEITDSSFDADTLVELQAEIPEVYQPNACWIMHPQTFTQIKKWKDGNGQYIINPDYREGYGYSLLGKRVYLSDKMPYHHAGSTLPDVKIIIYGDIGGYYVNVREDVSLQVLNEKYADEHAVGVVGWLEIDGKVIEPQKIRYLHYDALGENGKKTSKK